MDNVNVYEFGQWARRQGTPVIIAIDADSHTIYTDYKELDRQLNAVGMYNWTLTDHIAKFGTSDKQRWLNDARRPHARCVFTPSHHLIGLDLTAWPMLIMVDHHPGSLADILRRLVLNDPTRFRYVNVTGREA